MYAAWRWMKQWIRSGPRPSPLDTYCNDNVTWRLLPPALTLTVRVVHETNEWHRLEGVRSIHDFLDPTTGSVADTLKCFFDIPHDNGAFHHGHRFRGVVAATAPPAATDVIQQHARVSVPRTEPMWTVCTPHDGSGELQVLASIVAWLATGHSMKGHKFLYPDMYQQFRSQLRFPDKASPMDLIHLVARHMDDHTMTQCVVQSLHWMSQFGCDIHGTLSDGIGDKFLGIETAGCGANELLLLCRHHGLVRRCYSVPWSKEYIHTAADLLQTMQQLLL